MREGGGVLAHDLEDGASDVGAVLEGARGGVDVVLGGWSGCGGGGGAGRCNTSKHDLGLVDVRAREAKGLVGQPLERLLLLWKERGKEEQESKMLLCVRDFGRQAEFVASGDPNQSDVRSWP